MKKNIFLLFCWCLSITFSHGQKIDFIADIQPIIQKNCTPCHHSEGAAPFPLTSYNDLVQRKTLIKIVTQSRYMPPWFADSTFSRFHGERILSAKDIRTLAAWADQKTDSKKAKKATWKNIDTETEKIKNREKITIGYNKPFLIPDNNSEQFRVFVLPTKTDKDLYIKGIAFYPEAKTLAHHNRVMIDTTRRLRADDGIEVGEKSEFQRLNIQLADQFWYGWLPGRNLTFYPKGIAKKLPKNADFIINMHYAPTPISVADSARIVLFPVSEKDTIERIAQTFILDEKTVVNEPFEIAADTVVKFYMRSPPMPFDLSLMSVLPHMHLLGKDFKCYAITLEGDLIPILKINDWNFNWQMNYQFPTLLKLPKGATVFAEATYDNTAKNPTNPYSPPKKIKYGWATKNEMMNVIFEYVPYKKGDESIKN